MPLLSFTVAAPVLVPGKASCAVTHIYVLRSMLDCNITLHRGDMDRAAAACAV